MQRRIAEEDLIHILQNGGNIWENLRGKNIFITGGTGFFGKWLLESFLFVNEQKDLKANMTVLSRNPDSFIQQFPQFMSPSIKFIKGDIRDFKYPEGEFHFILHCATAADAVINDERPLEMLDTITQGTRRVLDFAIKQPLEAFLFTSSGAVYGKQPEDVTHIREDQYFSIDINDPKSAYAEGKRLAELYCSTYYSHYGLPVKIARCFAFVGPYLPLDKHFAIGNFILSALKNEDILIKGDGTTIRSYMYASDLMVWLWTILLKGDINKPFNVGSDESVSIKQLAEKISSISNGKVAVKILGSPVQKEHVDIYCPSITKANTINAKIKIQLTESIEKTIKFYESHQSLVSNM